MLQLRAILTSWLLPLCAAQAAASLDTTATTVNVTTAQGFQDALNAGIPHVVITEHLDLTGLGPASADSVMNAGVAYIAFGTKSIRGNCIQEPTTGLEPPRTTDTQCVLDIFEDFLELAQPTLWLSDIYVNVVGGVDKDHTTLLGVHFTDAAMYLTDCVLRGDGFQARAVDITPQRRFYARGTTFHNFEKNEMAAVRISAGATATFKDCVFAENEVSPDNAGPAIGLQSTEDADDGTQSLFAPSFIWLSGCTFDNNLPTSVGDISVQPGCRVFSDNLESPVILEPESRTVVTAWQTVAASGAGARGDRLDAELFATERDGVFVSAVEDQARVTGLPAAEIQKLPTDLRVIAPQTGDDDDSGTKIYAICGGVAAFVLLAALIALAVYYARVRRSRKALPHAESLPHDKEADFCKVEQNGKSLSSSRGGGSALPAQHTDSSRDRQASALAHGTSFGSSTLDNPSDGMLARVYEDAGNTPLSPPAAMLNAPDLYSSWPYSSAAGDGAGRPHSPLPPPSDLHVFGSPDGPLLPTAPGRATAGSNTLGTINTPVSESDAPNGRSVEAAQSAWQLLATPVSGSTDMQSAQRSRLASSSLPPGSVVAPLGGAGGAAATMGTTFDETVAPGGGALDMTHEAIASALDGAHAAGAPVAAGKFTLLGSVHRRLGGQGVVELAAPVDTDPRDETAHAAIKFYVSRAAFDRVLEFRRSAAAAAVGGALLDTVEGDAADAEFALPPAVVMRRGEPLGEWAARTRPHLPALLAALHAVAAELAELHAGGYTYYAMKPSNVVRLPDGSWRLIDFACAARTGTTSGLAFSLNYAAPEVLAAHEAGARTISAAPAADVWALGVVAYELLSGGRAFPLTTSSTAIRAQIMAREALPWERPGGADALRTAKSSVLRCLAREADARPTAEQLASMWRNLLEFAAVKHTVVTSV